MKIRSNQSINHGPEIDLTLTFTNLNWTTNGNPANGLSFPLYLMKKPKSCLKSGAILLKQLSLRIP